MMNADDPRGIGARQACHAEQAAVAAEHDDEVGRAHHLDALDDAHALRAVGCPAGVREHFDAAPGEPLGKTARSLDRLFGIRTDDDTDGANAWFLAFRHAGILSVAN